MDDHDDFCEAPLQIEHARLLKHGGSGLQASWVSLTISAQEMRRRSVLPSEAVRRRDDTWLKTALVQAAWAASRTKKTYLAAQFHRLKSRRGPKKAAVAVAASVLTAAYCMLRDGTAYRDLGPTHFDVRDRSRTTKRLIQRLADLGVLVEVRQTAAAS